MRAPATDVLASRATRWYATILSLLHTLTAVAWLTYRHIPKLATSPRAICWPLFEDCASWRQHFDEREVLAWLVVYMALGVVGAALFLLRRPRAGLIVFVATTLLGAALYALDYRLRFNQIYMFSWVVIVFLLVRDKLVVLQALVASFYFWAGTLKLNREWVSGAALYAKPWLVPPSLIPASCVYVLVLELVLCWGLFSSRARVRWIVYAQLVLFHVVSFGVVGYFYPLLMLGLGAVYPLGWLSGPGTTLCASTLRSHRRIVFAVVGAFSIFQLVPHLFPGDTAVTGEGRLFALHMFDARIECTGGGTLVAPDGSTEHRELIDYTADLRSRCDPLGIYGTVRWLCGDLSQRGDTRRLDVSISARRTTDAHMRPLIEVNDICHAHLGYSPWHHNVWILGD
ncbi:MAG: hypothetical protein ABI321_01480 [Polyangia bacterium]